MKRLTVQDKQEMKEEAAIWRHGRKKGALTVAKNKLLETGLGKHPDVIKVIALLESEHAKLSKKHAFDF